MTPATAADYHAVAAGLSYEGRAFIAGRFVAAAGGEAMAQYLQTKTSWISLKSPAIG